MATVKKRAHPCVQFARGQGVPRAKLGTLITVYLRDLGNRSSTPLPERVRKGPSGPDLTPPQLSTAVELVASFFGGNKVPYGQCFRRMNGTPGRLLC